MSSVHALALRWRGEGRRVVAATLVETVGSAPLDPGAVMLVDDQGRIEGSVTGGCVEAALVDEAQGILAGAPPRVATYGISDSQAADVGLMCGGTVRVFVAELRDVEPLASDRETVDASLDDLRFAQREGTPLYDAIAAAYEEMARRAQPGRINAIVVLSDGQDTDSSISLDSLVAKIGASSAEGGDDAPVRIFPIAYGEGADTGALQRIAEATGGQWFDASDAAKIDLVFASVINNF